MPVTMLRPLMEPTVRSTVVSNCAAPQPVPNIHTFANLPEVGVHNSIHNETCFWSDQNRSKHGRVDQERALQEQMQCPLCAIVLVPASCPSLGLRHEERLEGHPQRRLLSVPTLPYPLRIDMLGHMVCVRIRHEPRNDCRSHGGENQPS